jgi:ribonucleoside-diphosphate reductase alpha chain
MLDALKRAEGSVQEIAEIPEEMRLLYRTSWELPQKALIDLAVGRGPFIDQSQSLNLFVESPNIGKLSSMYMYAWKSGLKTTYYLRSRPATRITKTTIDEGSPIEAPIGSIVPTFSEAEALACSLENPEHCEACE